MPQEFIHVKGAREHNLKNIDISIPREKLVVITGVSGSGKSSLAFDTIYAEGQRRYVESLSAYARQFLGRMDKPDVDYIEGLSPAISIDQKGVSHNPRSTVGTVTEIYDYLRLLFARVGRPHCPKCSQPVQRQTVQQIVDSIMSLPEESRILVLAPKIRRKKGEHKAVFEAARQAGFVRVRVNGTVHLLDELDDLNLDKQKWHYIEIVVDRLIIRQDTEVSRVSESVETALREGDGVVQADVEGGEELTFSEQFACVKCGTSIAEIEPRTFSFNSPHGACTECTGLGYKLEVDPDLVISNKNLALTEGAISPWSRGGPSSSWYVSLLESIADANGFSAKVPVRELTKEQLDLILYGNGTKKVTIRHRTRRGRVYSWDSAFEGVIPNLERRYKRTESDHTRQEIERYMAARSCRACGGNRLRPEALSVTVCGLGIMDVCAKNIGQALEWVQDIDPDIESSKRRRKTLTTREKTIGNQILKEIEGRLRFLGNIGLDYITLGRTARTLSGGEAQRVRLATQIGSGLTGVLYVCDEPTVGLHPHDDHLLIGTLSRLRDMGNTVVVVEHDEAMMRAADFIADLGPGAGEHGGYVVATGTIQDIMDCPESLTGQYLSGRKKVPVPEQRREGNGLYLTVRGGRENNLKDIDVDLPLGQLVCVTGVSGSGKSTLIYDILFKKMAQTLYRARDLPGKHDDVLGMQNIDKVVNIDQSPIGRTPRSNPATYTGAFTPIRELFANLPEAKVRGYAPGRFSFNVKGGRCEACQGDGYNQIEMQFLPDVTVPCEVCNGKRYNREALEVTLRGKNIAEVLSMTVDQALEFFGNFPRIRPKLETLRDVGLGYIRLGQPATTLSGGEAQRVKLSTELSKRATGKTLYLLDEPTTGLSFEDCAALLRVLHRLVDGGNTVILIEHNLDIIKNADWVIDLGPGAGDLGGELIATGTPEQVAKNAKSHTGRYLKSVLKSGRPVAEPVAAAAAGN
ncbi:MAG: excinuclease ABC subunit UvrA [Chloroflexi bacterium]|nr:excinuclease ABC subunit UvrA [Chloroflexota bacterium]MCH8349071.1 excinuclease ABC subunit UvrA [Chloroflexota bacterium]MCI0780646.1 excinuclease ABC subunit UvrA [Chloroflexota bacterium]MCI0785553.1 excinuclease ABC subunit UvrA [Chloroflexota bacterium]MCI0792895.1 excinuclease ABC subunit UvrA [Chloroflexota bacterium]